MQKNYIAPPINHHMLHKKTTSALLFYLIATVSICTAITSCFFTAKEKITAVILSAEQKKELIARPKKIVGLVPVRNEEAYIDQCLKALSLYTDAIIVLDDASTDNTLSIVESVAEKCNVAHIIKKTVWFRDEPGDRNALLEAGRAVGGTHFIALDADEMFTAPCLKDNYLKERIRALEPGDRMYLGWLCLWKNLSQFQVDQEEDGKQTVELKIFAFCDDGLSKHYSGFIHTCRHPNTLCQGKKIEIPALPEYGVLHFMAVNWRNMRMRQAWYRCLEHIRDPKKPILSINALYNLRESEINRLCKPAPSYWFDYPFFNSAAYEAPEQWREKEILSWFKQYGIRFFADLDIWDIDWNL